MVRQSWREYRSLQSGFPALSHHQTLEPALHARSVRENTAGQLCAHRHVSRGESFLAKWQTVETIDVGTLTRLKWRNIDCNRGLEDQMLSLVAIQERPDLEQARNVLIESNAEMRKELQQIEDRILYRLSVSEGSAVDDMDLILTLEASKVKSEQIKVCLDLNPYKYRRVDRPFKSPGNTGPSLPRTRPS